MTTKIRNASMTLQQAAASSPVLAQLAEQAQASAARLSLARSAMPASLRQHVQAGALEDGQWCLLAPSTAVAAKLRQCVPAIVALLASHGQGVQGIRVKVSQGLARPLRP